MQNQSNINTQKKKQKQTSKPESITLPLELLKRIPRNKKTTTAELQEQLASIGHHRTLRAIQRCLNKLSTDFDIECDNRTKPYGYRWKEQARGLNLPVLSGQESLLLALAEEHLRHLLPTSLFKSMENFFAQAHSNLGLHTQAKQEREWLSKVRVVSTTQPLLPPQIEPNVLEEVSNALYENKLLDIEYQNATGKRTKARIMPLGLAQQGTRLYLACRFADYNNERSLALHRILSANATSFIFQRPAFDLEKYDADGRFGLGSGTPIRLSFLIDKAAGLHLLESPLSEDQQVEVLEKHFKITATLVDTAQLEAWLLGFGNQVCDVHRQKLAREDSQT
ncbi:helix-turn-helix transcriptional regulator [Undibacterium sp. WLX3042]|uniref:helix-turn-helix transcriptional regulator n=1 Tax=Undibacterium sp. WLX3042 TaxID=3412686 RepID=UPI003C2F1224